jgi:hypothetical protein
MWGRRTPRLLAPPAVDRVAPTQIRLAQPLPQRDCHQRRPRHHGRQQSLRGHGPTATERPADQLPRLRTRRRIPAHRAPGPRTQGVQGYRLRGRCAGRRAGRRRWWRASVRVATCRRRSRLGRRSHPPAGRWSPADVVRGRDALLDQPASRAHPRLFGEAAREAVKAHALGETGRTTGKIVLTVDVTVQCITQVCYRASVSRRITRPTTSRCGAHLSRDVASRGQQPRCAGSASPGACQRGGSKPRSSSHPVTMGRGWFRAALPTSRPMCPAFRARGSESTDPTSSPSGITESR